MKHVGFAAVVAIVVLGTAGALTYKHWPEAANFEILGKPTLEPQIMRQGSDASDVVVPTKVVPAATQPGETRTAMLDRLAKGTPSEQLQAVRELRTCQAARRWDANRLTYPALPGIDYEKSRANQGVPPTAQACDGILAGQEASANVLLAQAALGGASGATFEIYRASNDMPSVEWHALFDRAIDEQAAKGDTWAVSIKQMQRDYIAASGRK
jgi:hypothetical protein